MASEYLPQHEQHSDHGQCHIFHWSLAAFHRCVRICYRLSQDDQRITSLRSASRLPAPEMAKRPINDERECPPKALTAAGHRTHRRPASSGGARTLFRDRSALGDVGLCSPIFLGLSCSCECGTRFVLMRLSAMITL